MGRGSGEEQAQLGLSSRSVDPGRALRLLEAMVGAQREAVTRLELAGNPYAAEQRERLDEMEQKLSKAQALASETGIKSRPLALEPRQALELLEGMSSTLDNSIAELAAGGASEDSLASWRAMSARWHEQLRTARSPSEPKTRR